MTIKPNPKESLSGVEEKLESQEFYELMQTYRHTPLTEQESTTQAFEAVKEYVRSLISESNQQAMEEGVRMARLEHEFIVEDIQIAKQKAVAESYQKGQQDALNGIHPSRIEKIKRLIPQAIAAKEEEVIAKYKDMHYTRCTIHHLDYWASNQLGAGLQCPECIKGFLSPTGGDTYSSSEFVDTKPERSYKAIITPTKEEDSASSPQDYLTPVVPTAKLQQEKANKELQPTSPTLRAQEPLQGQDSSECACINCLRCTQGDHVICEHCQFEESKK